MDIYPRKIWHIYVAHQSLYTDPSSPEGLYSVYTHINIFGIKMVFLKWLTLIVYEDYYNWQL